MPGSPDRPPEARPGISVAAAKATATDTAPSTNAVVKPSSVGKAVPGSTWFVMIAAAI